MASIQDLIGIMQFSAEQKRRKEQERLDRERMRFGQEQANIANMYAAQDAQQKALAAQQERETKAAAEQRAAQEFATKRAEFEAQNHAQALGTGLRFIDQNPEAIGPVVEQLRNSGVPDEMLPRVFEPEAIDAWKHRTRQFVETAIPRQNVSNEVAQRLALTRPGLSQGMADYAAEAEELYNEQERLNQARAKRPGVVVNTGAPDGSHDLTRGTTAQVEQALIDDEIKLASLDDLNALGDPGKFLGFGNKLKRNTLGAIAQIDEDLLSPEDRSYLGDAREFVETVEAIFNAERKSITGAAAAVQELKSLRGAVLNSDLSGPAFRGSLEKLKRTIERNIEIRKRLLSEGLDVRTRGGRKAFDSAVRDAQRAEGLRAGGKSAATVGPLDVRKIRSKYESVDDAANALGLDEIDEILEVVP